MIYFMQLGCNGPIFIGIADDIEERLAILSAQHGRYLTILSLREGGKEELEAIYARFTSFRIGDSEKFARSIALMQFLGHERQRYPTRSIQHFLGEEGVRRVLSKTDGKCFWCNDPLKVVSIDHVIPTSKGGTDDEENLVPACRSCNSTKRDRSPEYLHKSRCLRKAGITSIISVKQMDYLIEMNLTMFRYDPFPW